MDPHEIDTGKFYKQTVQSLQLGFKSDKYRAFHNVLRDYTHL